MLHQRSESLALQGGRPQADGGPVLSGSRVDRLLVEPLAGSDRPGEMAPINGIWIGAAVGVVLWIAILGTVFLMWML